LRLKSWSNKPVIEQEGNSVELLAYGPDHRVVKTVGEDIMVADGMNTVLEGRGDCRRADVRLDFTGHAGETGRSNFAPLYPA
jgi:hypothetical protein